MLLKLENLFFVCLDIIVLIGGVCMRYILLFGFLLFLFGCQQEEQTIETGDIKPKEVEQQKDKKADGEDRETKEVDLSQFLKPNQSTAKFLGEGNEFATYIEKTTHLSHRYVGTIVDNGGVTMMTIYKINEDQIEIIFKEPVDIVPPKEATFPKIEELDSMVAIETYLAKPIEVGTKFGPWTIVETGATVETPYQTFENVFVIEEVGDGFVNRKYFVEGYGDIKTEFIMETDQEEEFIVTSTLESIVIK